MRPRLIHPVEVAVQPLDLARTTWDTRAREQVPSLARKPEVRLKAQVHWSSQGPTFDTPSGGTVQYDGWLVFRQVDLDAAGWTPADGDRVSQVDGAVVEIYLLGTGRHRGQQRRRFGGTARTLLLVPFEDRGQRHD